MLQARSLVSRLSLDGIGQDPPAVSVSRVSGSSLHRPSLALKLRMSPFVVPSASPPEGQVMCPQHGRRLKPISVPSGSSTLAPCADCVAEVEIKRREQTDHGSTITEPGTPMQEALPGPSIIGTAGDHQAMHLPGAGVARPDQISTLVAADLGDMIDAIIVEHRGALDLVITNLKNRAPGRSEMDQLSKELTSVSEAVRSVDTTGPPAVLDHNQRFSIILDTPPEFLRSRTKSIPDLIEFVESAAQDLGYNLSATQDHEPGRLQQPTIQVVSSEDASTTAVLSNARFAVPGNFSTPYVTPTDTPVGSPTLRASDGGDQRNMTPADSTNISPSTVPATISPSDPQPSTLPPTISRSEPQLGMQPSLSSTDVANPAPRSRIPSIKNLAGTLTAPRKHLSATAKTPNAPWTRDSKAEWAAVKPSLVKERQKQQDAHLDGDAVKTAS